MTQIEDHRNCFTRTLSYTISQSCSVSLRMTLLREPKSLESTAKYIGLMARASICNPQANIAQPPPMFADILNP